MDNIVKGLKAVALFIAEFKQAAGNVLYREVVDFIAEYALHNNLDRRTLEMVLEAFYKRITYGET
jgi:hypothetical protein